MIRFFSVVASVGLVSGCAAVQVKELDQSKAGVSRAAGCPVELFVKQWPERSYEVIGKLEYKRKTTATYQGAKSQDTRGPILEELNAKACEVGADALHIDDPDYDDIGQSRSVFAGDRVIDADLLVFKKDGA